MLFKRIASLFRGPNDPSTLGLAWYSETQWLLLREVCTDGEKLEKNYEEWRHAAQARYDKLLKEGARIVKVPVDVVDLRSWCHEMGRPVDAQGRIAYVVNRMTQVKLGNIAKL